MRLLFVSCPRPCISHLPHNLCTAHPLTHPPATRPLRVPNACVQAVVREGEGYTDHPVHLGGEAFVLAELKCLPPVEKKLVGGR